MFLLAALVSFFSLAQAPGSVPVLLPPEVLEAIKSEFKLKKNKDVFFEKKTLTLNVEADGRMYNLKLDENKNSVDFADFGPGIKSFKISFTPEPPEVTAHKDVPVAAPAAEHGAPAASEHGAPAGGDHGAPAAAEPTKPILYFINRYREDKQKEQMMGLPCGKALKIQSHLDDLFGSQGIKVSAKAGRHLDIFGGDFLLLSQNEDKIFVTFFKLKDSRYANRLCKMSL